ncbi:MAG: hypothetical protein KGY43_08130 [Halodesulfurarchaeum sp.]|nr:hypothetical protein [Halodesulfurarchaeum sp.]
MTEDNNGERNIKRRTVLKGTAVASAAGIVGIPAFSGSAVAQSGSGNIYLSDSGETTAGVNTRLFTVELDDATGEAVLTLVTEITDEDFDNVDAIAATPDVVTLIDRDSSHLGQYDIDADTFTDLGEITGLPNLTVLASYSPDGTLYAASNTTNTLYTIDESTPAANEVGEIVDADVNGADIAFDSSGTMFLHSNDNDTLYTIDYKNPSGGEVQATLVGSDPGSSLTGMAVLDSGSGNLVGSSRSDDAIVVLDKTDGSRTDDYGMVLDGNSFDHTNGDMATAFVCQDCDSEGALAKYEFECVERDEETDECLNYDFVLEGDGDNGISYAGDNYENKEGEENEPISVTFGTEYCDLEALVKAGPEEECVDVTVEGGEATVDISENSDFTNDKNDRQYAISYVEVYCECPE